MHNQKIPWWAAGKKSRQTAGKVTTDRRKMSRQTAGKCNDRLSENVRSSPPGYCAQKEEALPNHLLSNASQWLIGLIQCPPICNFIVLEFVLFLDVRDIGTIPLFSCSINHSCCQTPGIRCQPSLALIYADETSYQMMKPQVNRFRRN